MNDSHDKLWLDSQSTCIFVLYGQFARLNEREKEGRRKTPKLRKVIDSSVVEFDLTRTLLQKQACHPVCSEESHLEQFLSFV